MALTDALIQSRKAAQRLWGTPWLRRVSAIALIGLSFIFLALAIRDASSTELIAAVDATDYAAVGLAGAIYGLLLMLLARSWALAPALGTPGIDTIQAIAVYGTSILPKYIPGSIVQYASRQYLGLRLGWNALRMAQATLLEIVLHVLCSLSIALALLVQLVGSGLGDEATWYAAGIASGSVIAAVGLLLLARRMTASVIFRSTIYQLVFFVGLAGLAMFCGALFGVDGRSLLPLGGLFLLSWLIGFLVPLAPGGLGVREVAGLAMLAGLVEVEKALLVLAAMRVVSIIGDVLIFLGGLACQRHLRLMPS